MNQKFQILKMKMVQLCFIKFPKPDKKVTNEAIKIMIKLNWKHFKTYLELVMSQITLVFLHASKNHYLFK